jgi:predicted AlkP superfamily pyrophosphatase or phosphodiesterase
MKRSRRRVVFTIIDGMSTEAFEQVTGSGRAPALQFLKDRSSYLRDSVAVFPTITPCATASLVTGEDPARHGIPGMCWYDRDRQRFVNYGQSPRVAVVNGLNEIIEDFLVNLNVSHLSPGVSTLHEQLEGDGFTTASINFMVFRGPNRHILQPNLLERLLFRRRLPAALMGPKEHYFADIVSGPTKACSKLISVRGLDKRIKATDSWAACIAHDLVKRGATDMILFYLHENDHSSHQKGPASQVESLVEADRHLGHVLDSLGSWERTAEEIGFVLTSDHSQSPVSDDDDHVFALEDILDDFSMVKAGRNRSPFGSSDIALTGNGRVGFVYLNQANRGALLRPVGEALARAPGIDQVMWRDADGYVVDSDRGRLRFRSARDNGLRDERGHRWLCDGDLDAVTGVVDGGDLRTPEYPGALWRIKSALDLDRIGDLVVTTKLAYELKDLAGGDHKGGGDHGSLHAQDSLVPFLSTLDRPPLHPSTVDAPRHIVEHFRREES